MRAKLSCVLFVILLLPLSAAAQQGDVQGRLRLVGIFPNDDGIPVADTGSHLGISSTVSIQPGGTYMVHDDWAVAVDIDIARLSIATEEGRDAGLHGGTVWMTAPTVTLQYHPPVTWQFRPYVGVGASMGFLFGYDISADLLDVGVSDLRFEPFLGGAAQVGINFEVNDRLQASLDLKYQKTSTEVDVLDGLGSVYDSVGLDLNPWVIGIGIGYWF